MRTSPGWYPDPISERWWDGRNWSTMVRRAGERVGDGLVADAAGSPSPGWYPDEETYRYWDGDAWTDHVRSRVDVLAGVQTPTVAAPVPTSSAPVHAAPPPPASSPSSASIIDVRRAGRSTPWLLVACVVLAAALGVVGTWAFLAGGEGGATVQVEAPITSVAVPTTVPATAAPTTAIPTTQTPTSTAVVTSPPTLPPTTVVVPNRIVFPYDFFAVPQLSSEMDVMGSGCDTDMGDGLWHGFVTSIDGAFMSIDRVCALMTYGYCSGPTGSVCNYSIENKLALERSFPLSPGFAVYQGQWSSNGCTAFTPSFVPAGVSEATWIQIERGQVVWMLRPCEY